MILKFHIDEGYPNVVGDKSRVGGYFYMGNKPWKIMIIMVGLSPMIKY